MPSPTEYIVTDGKLVLKMVNEGEWFVVTCPFDPEIVTQARTIDEAFEMARDLVSLRGNDRPGGEE